MRGHRLLIAGAMTLAVAGGCKRRPAVAPPAVPAPTTRVTATTAPADPVAAVQPTAAFMFVNNQSFTFPAAKLVTRTVDDGLRVTLFSDDPPETVKDGYQGNSFYFRFVIDAAGVADLAGQQFVYSNSAAEQDETTSGLFIAGGRQTLRPLDAVVSFEQANGVLLAHVAGTFRLFDEQTAADTAAIVRVNAVLEPSVVAPKK